MKLDYFILSRSSSIDLDTNAVSIFEILEEVQIGVQNTAQETIPKLFQLHVSFTLSREPEEVGELNQFYRIIGRNPSGTEIFIVENLPVHLDATKHRARVRVSATFNITTSGIYKFQLLINADPIAEYSFTVKYLMPPVNP
jgi:hypothetical protein